MSVIVYTESEGGSFKKIAQEAVSYAKGVADAMGTTVTAVAINAQNTAELGTFGASKVMEINDDGLAKFNAEAYAGAISQAAKAAGASVVVLSSSANSKFLAPLVAIDLEAGYVPNVTELPVSTSPFTVKHSVFTNKAFAHTHINTDVKIIGLSKNSFGIVEQPTSATAEAFSPEISGGGVEVVSVDKATDKVTIADAEVVVSGGRGLKGPENWGLIEELAD
ncbi:MAG: electron transfer flavoprotein subunit alpha/FixB family protein, partial [Bacteroidota bacterium]